jgi:hypothetical protein
LPRGEGLDKAAVAPAVEECAGAEGDHYVRTFPPIIKAALTKKIFFTIYCPSRESPKGG